MPVSPYPSWREPTSTVRLTVTFDWELSGKSNARRPLSNWYSVMPSTVATLRGEDGSAAIRWQVTKAAVANESAMVRPAEEEKRCDKLCWVFTVMNHKRS